MKQSFVHTTQFICNANDCDWQLTITDWQMTLNVVVYVCYVVNCCTVNVSEMTYFVLGGT